MDYQYKLKHSDPTNTSTVIVPTMPPGINSVDTSLDLVGRGYPNYGQAIAQNFLKLLENFAGPIPPENPIQGQLWYDTSDITKKILRVMDGTATATRWPSATGIYQQSTDPKDLSSAGLKNGDIWVDTSVNQLRIYKNGNWTTVGPSISSGSSKTGIEISAWTEKTTGIKYPVVLTYVNNEIISIASADYFRPAGNADEDVPAWIMTTNDGVNQGVVRRGINFKPMDTDPALNLQDNLRNYKIWGDSDVALNLKVNNVPISGNKFLIKDDVSGQIITGNITFSQDGTAGAANSPNGVVINTAGNPTSEYVQFFKEGNNAVLYNSVLSGSLIIRPNTVSKIDTVSISDALVEIKTTSTISKSLTVYDTLTVSTSTTASVVISGGGINISKDIILKGKLQVGSLTGNGVGIVPITSGTYDIGTPALPFANIYANRIHSTGTSLYALSLNVQTVTAYSVGATTISASTITVNSSLVNITGEIKPFAGISIPTGWLTCNGSTFSTSTYASLFSVIGYTYGGSGSAPKVPNMSTSTYVTTGTSTGTYLTYIIKT
jgi:hypothetical protein